MRYYIVKTSYGLICYQVPLNQITGFQQAFGEYIIATGMTIWDAITEAGFNTQAAATTLN